MMLLFVLLLILGCTPKDISYVDNSKWFEAQSNDDQTKEMPFVGQDVSQEDQPNEKNSYPKNQEEQIDQKSPHVTKNKNEYDINKKINDLQQKSNEPQEKPFCEGSGPVTFTVSPMKTEDLDYIDPMGMMIGGHVTPIDHQYYYAKGWTPKPAKLEDLKEIHTPAAGVIRDVQRMPTEFKTSEIGDYRIIIDHSCTFYSIYIHLNLLSPKLQAMIDNRGTKAIKVEAGEVIGKARSFDFSVHNEEIRLKGFVVPAHYVGEGWKIHTVDPFDYFAEPLRSTLLEKDLRTALPRGGKIDYDVDGKLIGNWFMKDTGGYSGKNHGEYGYWKTHLAFAPNALEPTQMIASLGNFNGEAKQFGIKGNGPDPALVGVKNGLVKYELVSYYYVDSQGKPLENGIFKVGAKVKNEDMIEGTLLIELLDARTLKAEVFPGKSKGQVAGFVNPTLYER